MPVQLVARILGPFARAEAGMQTGLGLLFSVPDQLPDHTTRQPGKPRLCFGPGNWRKSHGQDLLEVRVPAEGRGDDGVRRNC
jgi:hypothetical protein